MSSSTKVFTLLLAGVALLLVGCAGPSPTGSSAVSFLTSDQIQQLYTSAHTEVYAALKAAGDTSSPIGIAKAAGAQALLPHSEGVVTALESVRPLDITTTTGSYTYTCPSGGTIALSWTDTINGSQETRSTSIAPSECSDGSIILTGNPNLAIIESDSTSNSVDTLNLYGSNGNFKFSPVTSGAFPTGTCSVGINIVATINASTKTISNCAVSWSVCGQTISDTCSSFFSSSSD